MKVFILDDVADRIIQFKKNLPPSWDITSVMDYDAAIQELTNHGKEYELLFLDHDLGGEQMVDPHSANITGYTLAKWIVENLDNLECPSIIVHSLNPYGALSMLDTLAPHFPVSHVPFAWMPEEIEKKVKPLLRG